MTILSIEEARRRKGRGKKGAPAGPKRPPPDEGGEGIRVRGGELHLAVEQAEAALAQAGGTYQRGTALVQVRRLPERRIKGGVAYLPGTLLLMPLDPVQLRVELTRATAFLKFDKRSGAWVRVDAPPDVAAGLHGAAGRWPNLLPISGLAAVPLFRNGKVIDAPGLDAESGLFLDLPHGLTPVPVRCTRNMAERALERLLRPFRGFLDHKTAQRAALAAAAITAAARPSLTRAPAIVVNGNDIGVGKGLCAKALAALAAGRGAAMITEGPDDAEMEKRIAAALIEAAPVIILDNLQRKLASSTLESILTEGVASIRRFGELTAEKVHSAALVLITSNNATLRRDMLRRCMPVRLAVKDPRPSSRTFGFSPVDEVLRDRPALIHCALTILRAWHLAKPKLSGDERKSLRTLGSFEDWADLVGGAVWWLTGEHPVDLIVAAADSDPDVGAERAVIADLAARFPFPDGFRTRDAATQLPAETWATVAQLKGGTSDLTVIGNWLRARKDRVIGNHRLIAKLDRKGVAIWRLEPMPGLPGLAGASPTEREENAEPTF